MWCATFSCGTHNSLNHYLMCYTTGVQRSPPMSTAYRMERAFLSLVFREIDCVQNPLKAKGFIPYRATMWRPKNIRDSKIWHEL